MESVDKKRREKSLSQIKRVAQWKGFGYISCMHKAAGQLQTLAILNTQKAFFLVCFMLFTFKCISRVCRCKAAVLPDSIMISDTLLCHCDSRMLIYFDKIKTFVAAMPH